MSVNVNEAFAAERASQAEAARNASAAWDQRIADGKLIPLANGTFRVNDPGSWDNGEIFSQVNGVAMPQTGLDVVNGETQLFSAVETWHQSGNVRTGVTSVDEVLELAGLNFRVEKSPSWFYAGGELREAPGEFITYRDDTFAKLGAVGSVYTPFQNAEAAAFLQDLVNRYDVQFESAGPLNGGKKVFISMNLPSSVIIDEGGLNDIVEPKICWMNDHQGEGKAKVIVTPWRPVCKNTNRFALRDAVTSWGVRHTANGMAKLEEARKTLGFSVRYYEEFAAEETALARTAIELDEFDAFLASLWPAAEGEQSKRSVTLAARRDASLHELFAVEARRVGRTAYAAEQSVTDYLDHVAPRRAVGDKLAAARATAILDGASDDLKSRAHKQLLLLTNR